MAETQLPQQINILREIEQASSLQGEAKVKDMSRLLSSLSDDSGNVEIDFHFGKDKDNIKFLKGHIHGVLKLICQRCLQPMDYVIDDEICLSPVLSDGQAKALPDHYEALLVNREGQKLLPIIEDELILRLPIVALHDTDECHANIKVTEPAKSEQKDNPFARELSKLKAK